MGEPDRAGDLRNQGGSLTRRRPLLAGVLREGPTPDELHDQVRAAIVEVEVVHPDDVGMLQLGQAPALLDESGPAVLVHRLVGELQDEVAAEFRMHDPEHLGLPRSGELPDDAVLADRLRHRRAVHPGRSAPARPGRPGLLAPQ